MNGIFGHAVRPQHLILKWELRRFTDFMLETWLIIWLYLK